MRHKPNICFISDNYYKMLHPLTYRSIGGAELQESFLIRELIKRGYQITVITNAHNMPDRYEMGHLTVLSTCNLMDGYPILRFFYPRLYKFWKAIRSIDADIYYIRTPSHCLCPIVVYAKSTGKKVVYSGASDVDFSPKKLPLPLYRDRMMFQWGLRRVDAVIVQNREQQRLLRKYFGKRGRRIPNGMPQEIHQSSPKRETILWIGMLRPVKRPEIFLWLAKQNPQWRFVMVGGPMDGRNSYYDRLKEDAGRIPNLIFMGFLGYSETERIFSSARVFINTSEREGFPNTFLQAWARGVPVISFIDPDDVIRSKKLGMVADNSKEMDHALKKIMNDDSIIDPAWITACFKRYFTIENSVDAYERLFRTLYS